MVDRRLLKQGYCWRRFPGPACRACLWLAAALALCAAVVLWPVVPASAAGFRSTPAAAAGAAGRAGAISYAYQAAPGSPSGAGAPPTGGRVDPSLPVVNTENYEQDMLLFVARNLVPGLVLIALVAAGAMLRRKLLRR